MGLVYSSVDMKPFSRRRRISRKQISEVELLKVNLMEGWKEFRKPLKEFNSSSVPIHKTRMSSMKRIHRSLSTKTGLLSSRDCSNLPMKRFATVGAIGVPMAVPHLWRYTCSKG